MDRYKNRDKFDWLADEMEREIDGGVVDADAYQNIIDNLRGLEYDDFANNKFATPKMQMITDFQKVGRNDIVAQIKDGEFDQ